MIQQSVEKTGKFAGLTRLTTRPTTPSQEELDQPVPRFLRRTAAVPLGRGAGGNLRFLQGIGSPLEEINKFDLTDPEKGFVGSGARALLSQLNPALRAIPELGLGRDTFFDQDIVDLNRANKFQNLPGLRQLLGVREVDIGEGRTRLEGDPDRLFLSRLLPTSRLVGEAGRVADLFSEKPRDSRSSTVARLLSGLRVREVDPVEQERAKRQTVEDKLREFRASGDVRIFRSPFGVKDAEGAVRNPEVEKLLQQFNAIKRIQRAGPGG